MSASVYNFVLVNLDRLLVFKLPFQQQADSSRKNIKIGKYWYFISFKKKWYKDLDKLDKNI